MKKIMIIIILINLVICSSHQIEKYLYLKGTGLIKISNFTPPFSFKKQFGELIMLSESLDIQGSVDDKLDFDNVKLGDSLFGEICSDKFKIIGQKISNVDLYQKDDMIISHISDKKIKTKSIQYKTYNNRLLSVHVYLNDYVSFHPNGDVKKFKDGTNFTELQFLKRLIRELFDAEPIKVGYSNMDCWAGSQILITCGSGEISFYHKPLLQQLYISLQSEIYPTIDE